MRTPYDQFDKAVLRELLARAGTVSTDEEVSAETQRIDVAFVLDPARVGELQSLGRLGELALCASGFEPFHCTPRLSEMLDCLQKQLVWRATLEKQASAKPTTKGPVPLLWILSSGRPSKALEAMGFRRVRGSRGEYRMPPGIALGLVVLSELPCTRATLTLRLLGAGKTLRGAIRELASLPKDSLEAQALMPHLLLLRVHRSQELQQDEELLMATENLYDKLVRECREVGLQQGLQEGLQQGLQEGRQEGAFVVTRHLLELRLKRSISELEHEALRAKLRDCGVDRVSERVLLLSPKKLLAWLGDAAAR